MSNASASKSSTLLQIIAASTGIDSFLLLEDDGFTRLLDKCSHGYTWQDATRLLEDYINENY